MKIDASLTFDAKQSLYTVAFRAMGTDCVIKFSASDRDRAASFAQEAVQWVANFETKYSRFRDSSLISEINRQAGKNWVEIDSEVESIFSICDDLHFMTQGVLDPTMLPLIRLWDYHKTPASVPTDQEVDKALELVGWKKVERRPGSIYLPQEGMSLDLGGFGKEYAVDKVAAMAVGYGLPCCLVDFGRDIHAVENPPSASAWHIALENPEKPDTPWASIAARNLGIATSGDYCRFFEKDGQRFGHIIDPRSGRPVANAILAVSILANSCLEAGVLSTAAFVMGEEDGLKLIEGTFGAEGCFVFNNGIQQTSNFYQHVVQN